ncbi:unnamed protein product [Boreogadus saida]
MRTPEIGQDELNDLPPHQFYNPRCTESTELPQSGGEKGILRTATQEMDDAQLFRACKAASFRNRRSSRRDTAHERRDPPSFPPSHERRDELRLDMRAADLVPDADPIPMHRKQV